MMAIESTTNLHSLKTMLSPFVELDKDVMFREFVIDSRAVNTGDVFLAWQGDEKDGSEYIADAIDNGAVAVLVDKDCQITTLNSNVPIIVIESLREKAGDILNRFYGDTSKALNVIGVTGTNGKTTITHAIAACLTNMESHVGVIGTLGNGIYPAITAGEYTTPHVLSVHQLFYEWHKQVDVVAMEVSSHALDQYRVAGIDFDIAVFSSFSRDHLDYHNSMDEYFAVKQRLFNDYDIKHAVINRGNPMLRRFADSIAAKCDVWTYELLDQEAEFALDEKRVQAKIIQREKSFVTLAIQSPWGNAEISGHWVADFVCENILAAFTVLCVSQKPFAQVIKALSKYQGVPGRMETMLLPNGATAVIDYAHTPDALDKALASLSEICTGKLFCVFGCGGDRDQGKRELMARAAEAYADHIIITNDNPRTEVAENIAKDILKGLSDTTSYQVELDRAIAIQTACENAEANDIVLIAGKGHENYQIIGQKKFPFSDRECIKRFCEAES